MQLNQKLPKKTDMKILKYKSALLMFLFFSVPSFACQQAILNESFPIKEFNHYDTIVIATITKVTKNNSSRYGGFNKFSAKVNEVIKGDTSIDSSIVGFPKKELARAVCPTSLLHRSTYLLLLNKDDNVYKLSRFSFPTKSDHPFFSKYVQEIKAGINNEEQL